MKNQSKELKKYIKDLHRNNQLKPLWKFIKKDIWNILGNIIVTGDTRTEKLEFSRSFRIKITMDEDSAF